MYSRMAHIPGTAMPFNPDKIGLAVTGATVAGAAAHGLATGVLMRKKPQQKRVEKGGDE
jgi:hypothetical protein